MGLKEISEGKEILAPTLMVIDKSSEKRKTRRKETCTRERERERVGRQAYSAIQGCGRWEKVRIQEVK